MSSHRGVERVAAVSAVLPSAATELCFTTSITSDPDNTWVAKRQSAITAALEARARNKSEEFDAPQSDLSPPLREGGERVASEDDASFDRRDARLSGESERIGQGDWSQTTPFGKHIGYL
nr:hypothetical protein [Neorhizobium tomejilense]